MQKKGEHYHFTFENGREIALLTSKVAGVEKGPKGETVTSRGEEVTLAQKARTLRKEKKAREKKLLRDIDTWARGKKGVEITKARVKALGKEERGQLFSHALLLGNTKSARLLAARELIAFDDDTSVPALALGAVKDPYRSVRDACLRSLKFFEKSRRLRGVPAVLGQSLSPAARTRSPFSPAARRSRTSSRRCD